MRVSYLTSLAFAGTVFAAPIVEAPAAEIEDITFVLDGYKVILNNAHQLIAKVTALKAGDDVTAVLKQMSALSGETISISEKMTADIKSKDGKLSTAATTKVAKPSAEVATTTVTM